MELYFNELSLDCSIPVEYAFITNLNQVYRRSREEGFSVCRFSVVDRQTMFDYLQSNPEIKNIRSIINFAYAFFTSPCEIPSSDLQETEFLGNDWSYQGRICGGLAWAYIHNTLSLSIASHIWRSPEITILRDSQETNVRNVSMEEHFDYHQQWLESNKEIYLITCDISPKSKKIALRDDHGRDILLDFSKKVRRNPYVVEIVNSLPFNSNCRTFIKRAKANGIVELVLTWTDKGLGLAVQTTGRNLRETQKIAELLEEEFGYR
jgi:hypothetical protein